MPSITNTEGDWDLAMVGGGKPLRKGSAYSLDNKYFLQPFNTLLKVFYISTRQCIKTIINLSLDKLVDSKIDPSQPNLIWLFKSNGEVIIVNWRDRLVNAVIAEFKFPRLDNLNSIVDFRFNYSLQSYEVLTINGKISRKREPVHPHKKTINKFTLKIKGNPAGSNPKVQAPEILEDSFDLKELLIVKNVFLYAKSLHSKSLAFLTENTSQSKKRDQLLELKLVELKSFGVHSEQSLVVKKDSRITSLAVSNSNLVAMGMYNGVVEILYNFVSATSQQASNINNSKILRWHINAVGALHFNKDSTYLLSGGKEKVLVFWQIDSDRLQFLPRLNGDISYISTNFFSQDIDSTIANNNDGIDYYTLILDINNSQNNELEYLILNSVELTSRLSINSIKLNTRVPLSQLSKERKKLKISDNVNIYKIQNDYSAQVEVNPVDKNLYLANGSEIQSYNLVKNEQFFSLNVVPKISIGKVRSEVQLKDPRVNTFKFTEDGKWMVTFDEYETPVLDKLISKGETKYNLKFWKLNTTESQDNSASGGNNNIHWELATKIVDPHGPNVKIVSITSAPSSYFKGTAFLTVDNKGGVRLWRPQQPKLSYNVAKANKTQPTAWTLRKFVPALTSRDISDVSVAWSRDATLIIVSLKNVLYRIPVANFDDWDYLTLNSSLISSKPIKFIKLINNDSNLIILNDEHLINYHLINDSVVYDYKLDKNNLQFNEKLIAFDGSNGDFAIAVNFFAKHKTTAVNKAIILLFKTNEHKPFKVLTHNYYISSLQWIPGTANFVIINSLYNIGIVNKSSGSSNSTSSSAIDAGESTTNPIISGNAISAILNVKSQSDLTDESGFSSKMVSLVQNTQLNGVGKQQQQSQSQSQQQLEQQKNGDVMDIDDVDNFWYGKRINNHTFDSLLNSDLDGMDMEDLFDIVVKSI